MSRLTRLPRRLPIALVAALPFTAAAQSQTDEPVQLEEIIVRANPLGRTADDLVQPTEVLAGAELDRRRGATIGETLEGQPGISTSDFGPAVGRPIIRGQGGARVSVLSNGIGSMDASTVSNDHAVAIDPAQAEAVEIIKGPATLLYGSGASAGVVNVVDDRIVDEVHEGLRLSADASRADNADEAQQRIDLGFGHGRWMFGADYAQRDANDLEIPGYADVHGAEHEAHEEDEHEDEDHDEEDHDEEEAVYGRLENSSLQTQSYGASLAWIGEGARYNLAVSRLESNYGIPSGAHAHEHEDEEEEHEEEEHDEDEAHGHEEGVRIDLEQTRVDGRAQWLSPLAAVESITLRFGVNDYTHEEIEGSGEVGTRFENDELESRLEVVHAPLAGWRGVIGTQLVARDFSALGEEAFSPPVETRSGGLFVVEERDQDWGRLELGARVEHTEHDPDSAAFSQSFTPLSASAGAIVDLNALYHLRLTATLAQRAPAAEELYADGPHIATNTFERGDQTLDVETSQNLEIGIDRHDDRWTWSASLYYNPIDDYVYLANADDDGDGVADVVDEDGDLLDGDEEGLQLVDYAQADARFYGFELATGYALLTGPLELNVRAFADQVSGTLDDGPDLPRITPPRWGAGVDGGWRGIGYAVNWTHVDEPDDLAPLETPTEAYDLLSADLSYTLSPAAGWTAQLYLRGRNLLDEDARRHTSLLKDLAPLPGRTLLAGINLQFG